MAVRTLHLVGHWNWNFSGISIVLFQMIFSFLTNFLLEYFTEEVSKSDVSQNYQLFPHLQN